MERDIWFVNRNKGQNSEKELHFLSEFCKMKDERDWCSFTHTHTQNNKDREIGVKVQSGTANTDSISPECLCWEQPKKINK